MFANAIPHETPSAPSGARTCVARRTAHRPARTAPAGRHGHDRGQSAQPGLARAASRLPCPPHHAAPPSDAHPITSRGSSGGAGAERPRAFLILHILLTSSHLHIIINQRPLTAPAARSSDHRIRANGANQCAQNAPRHSQRPRVHTLHTHTRRPGLLPPTPTCLLSRSEIPETPIC